MYTFPPKNINANDDTFRNQIGLDLQDGISLEFLNVMKGSNPPTISNMTTQSHPGDNMVRLFQNLKILIAHYILFNLVCIRKLTMFFNLQYQTVTADIALKSVSLFAHLIHQSNQQKQPNLYDVCLQLESLKGRLNLAVITRERLVIAKLDGWPEVSSLLHCFIKFSSFLLYVYIYIRRTLLHNRR